MDETQRIEVWVVALLIILAILSIFSGLIRLPERFHSGLRPVLDGATGGMPYRPARCGGGYHGLQIYDVPYYYPYYKGDTQLWWDHLGRCAAWCMPGEKHAHQKCNVWCR